MEIAIAGTTDSNDFPIYNALKSVGGDSYNDAFVVKFRFPVFKISISFSGDGKGKVKSEDGLLDCSTSCEKSFDQDSEIILQATAEPGSRFSEWKGDCWNCSTNSVCSVKMDTNKTCIVEFRSNSITDAGYDTYSDVFMDIQNEDISSDVSKDTYSDVVNTEDAFISDASYDIRYDSFEDIGVDLESEVISDITEDKKDILEDSDESVDDSDIAINDSENPNVDVTSISRDARVHKEAEADIYACSCNLVE